jgi:hypothetical protein
MNRCAIDQIANAVLYEGYILYPYRPSVKNRQRWTFGGIFPEAFCRESKSEASAIQTECLVCGTPETLIESAIRFLHLSARQVGKVDPPLVRLPSTGEPDFCAVDSLQVGDRLYHTWQEAEEREVAFREVTIGELLKQTKTIAFAFPASRNTEAVLDTQGQVAGILIRERLAIKGTVTGSALAVSEGLYRLTLRVSNCTPPSGERRLSRDAAALQSFASTHALLAVEHGEFVSLIDPPECWRDAASACANVGTWPVLVGAEGAKDTLLSAPIILYDYPQVAPESLGNFFDGTEIDEMLTLRVLTLTDQEKREMAAVDGRTSDLLERTEVQARDHLLSLHGTMRGLRPI